MTMIYDAMGNPTGYDDAISSAVGVQPTADPHIVKVSIPAGAPVPSWVTSTAQQADGSSIGYGPTDSAIAAGYVQAAEDTLAALPDQIAEQAAAAVKTTGIAAILIGVAFIAWALR